MLISSARVKYGLIAGTAAAPAATKDVRVQWYGRSGFKVTSPGDKVILIDPFIMKNPKASTTVVVMEPDETREF